MKSGLSLQTIQFQNKDAELDDPVDVQGTFHKASTEAAQRAKNEAAKQLILAWLAEDSSYDEETWPVLQKTIEENRLSKRRRFHG
jgi:hypothetical protein